MGLASNLQLTAEKLISSYGNTVTLSTVTTSGAYNPQTGTFGSPTTQEHTKMAYLAPVTNELLKQSGLPEGEWGKIKFVATMVEDSETTLLNNSWKIDGTPITKVTKTKAQNLVVVIKVYCG
jgi:hypothetical protein